jgi:alpha-ketoglutarate-dependent taurine dioxygenase
VDPTTEDESPGGAPPDALFDLAVNRAATFLRGARPTDERASLGTWHARTRFARRVPLGAVLACLAGRPEEGEWHWAGGPHGAWRPGRAPFP